MSRKSKFAWQCCIAVAILLFQAVSLFAVSGNREKKTLLYISSYGPDSYQMQDDLLRYLSDDSRRDVSYIVVCESMNCNAFTEVAEWQGRMDAILRKYPDPETVVLQGNEAVITYFAPDNERFRKVPTYVLQCNSLLKCLPESKNIPSMVPRQKGENMRHAEEIMNGFNVRYLELTEFDIKRNLDLIQRLHGNLKDVAVLTDNTYTGLCMQQAVRNEQRIYPKWTFHYIDGCYLNMQQALDRVKGLPAHTALMLGCWKIDRDKTNYLSHAVYAFKTTKPAGLLPVYSFSGAGMGYWALGGYIPQIEGRQKKAIDFFCADLNNGMVAEPCTYVFPQHFVFDKTQLDLYGIGLEELPENAVFLNRSLSMADFIRANKWQFLLAVSLVVFLLFITLVSVAYSVRLTKLKKSLLESEALLVEEKQQLETSLQKLKMADEQVEKANLAKTYFLSNMNHEIRTPLNSIVGFSQIIADMAKDNPELNEYAHILNQNSEGLLRLIGGLLDISDIKSGKRLVRQHAVDLVQVMGGMVESAKFQLKPQVDIVFMPQVDTLVMETDTGLLSQMMMHLLSNACKFTTEGGITVTLDREDKEQMAVISVTDTGCGISDEIRKVIFDRFDKAEEFIQGTGIGLTVCQTIVEAMEGRIWLDETYRSGARFVVCLPIH